MLGSNSLGSELDLLRAPNEHPGKSEIDTRGCNA